MIKLILEDTTKEPIKTIGKYAGICYNSNVADPIKNYNRGIECLKNNHGRAIENVRVSFVVEGYSAKFCRELYTHIGGAPTRLQESTRYIDYAKKGFDYVIPESVSKSIGAEMFYTGCMEAILEACKSLEDMGIPKEDASMLLPLGMCSKVVWNGNLRCLIEMSHQRLCSRAFWEFRKFMKELMHALSDINEEWRTVVDNYFVPKCKYFGKCIEKNSCGANKGE